MRRDLHETTLKLTGVVCGADLGAEDEDGSRCENHAVEVRRALDCEITESPYLARQLSVFDNRQLVTGLSEMMVGGLRHTQNTTVNTKRRTVYTGLGPHNRVIAFTSRRRVAFCVGLIGMIVYMYKGVHHTSLYIGERVRARI